MYKTEKLIFYHVPRTGGIYVKEAMRLSGIPYTRCKKKGGSHPFGLIREHETPASILKSETKGRLSFCFVRQPASWIRSFWSFRIKINQLDMKFPLDRIWDDDFNKFCENILEKYPQGFVTSLFRYYVDNVDLVGRQESLTEDLITILKTAGEKFNEAKLRSIRRHNMAAARPEYGNLCILNSKLESRINQADKWILDNYYKSNGAPNVVKLKI